MVIFTKMGYNIQYMRSNRREGNVLFSTSITTKGRQGVPFAPGLMLILLGIVVLLAPRLVLGAIAFVLLGLGLLLCYVAYKFIVFKRHVQELTKNLEGAFPGSGFQGHKKDIDLTDLESKKIIFH